MEKSNFRPPFFPALVLLSPCSAETLHRDRAQSVTVTLEYYQPQEGGNFTSNDLEGQLTKVLAVVSEWCQ
jgi:hypothetical protein